MPTSPDRNRRSARETVRRLFGHLRLIAALLVVGALIGFGQAYLQEKRFLGRLELATSGTPAASPARLPDIVQLRRLLLDPHNVEALLPGAEDENGPPASNTAAALAVRNTIDLEPIFSNTSSERVVWKMTTEIPAASPQAASAQLHHFAEQLQQSYDHERSAALAAVPWEGGLANGPDVAPVAYWTTDDGPTIPGAGPPPRAGEPGSRDSLEQQQAELEAEAQRLNVSLYGIRDALSQMRQQNESIALELRQVERDIQRRLNSLNRFETKGETTPLPADLEADYPELAAARKHYEDLRQQEGGAYARLTASHPLRKTFEKNVQEARQRLRNEQQEAMRHLRADVARLDQQAKQWRDAVTKNNQRIDQLLGLSARQESLEQQRRRQSEQELRRPDADARQSRQVEASPPVQSPVRPGPTTEQRPGSATPSAGPTTPEPRKLPETVTESGRRPATSTESGPLSGRPAPLLVAGPFVDARPLRPRPLRDSILGGLAGLAVGLLLAYVRSGADQRIHTQADIAELSLGLEVFGSIPELKRGIPPVQFVERPRP